MCPLAKKNKKKTYQPVIEEQYQTQIFQNVFNINNIIYNKTCMNIQHEKKVAVEKGALKPNSDI
jgi:hypothetical protein